MQKRDDAEIIGDTAEPVDPNTENGEEPEFKFTDKASHWNPLEDERKWWMWLHQIMAYCHMADTEYGRLWAVHNRGDYREQRISFYQYLFHFDKSELEGVWRMILKNS